jgi:hypothetical protein
MFAESAAGDLDSECSFSSGWQDMERRWNAAVAIDRN